MGGFSAEDKAELAHLCSLVTGVEEHIAWGHFHRLVRTAPPTELPSIPALRRHFERDMATLTQSEDVDVESRERGLAIFREAIATRIFPADGPTWYAWQHLLDSLRRWRLAPFQDPRADDLVPVEEFGLVRAIIPTPAKRTFPQAFYETASPSAVREWMDKQQGRRTRPGGPPAAFADHPWQHAALTVLQPGERLLVGPAHVSEAQFLNTRDDMVVRSDVARFPESPEDPYASEPWLARWHDELYVISGLPEIAAAQQRDVAVLVRIHDVDAARSGAPEEPLPCSRYYTVDHLAVSGHEPDNRFVTVADFSPKHGMDDPSMSQYHDWLHATGMPGHRHV